MRFKESALAHKYLDGLKGIEIGGSAHNSFGLDTKNVDYTADMTTVFKDMEEKMCGEKMPVDIIAEGDDLPLEDNSVDFVISSHVIEHFFDPIKAIEEWLRVVKPGGYIFTICPKQDADPLETRPRTKLEELLKRHSGELKPEDVDMDTKHDKSVINGMPFNERGHWTVWACTDMLELCKYLNLNVVEYQTVDDKVQNGFTVVIQKI
jgi:SAM-dependent methyltransferase